ncbi:hypothetical protein [Paucibacter sp. DJ2R-2]|uniref:hypothetical protein n=1 Tax=Paucibacter sp. DJ2R-2 TaxID=2893558 RepID=UPI0021E4FD79|nr:hypothetical protein [Paucibacter sp. DJ2R-2]MCV2421175.1 hypothetical protein [Paucibacter sp. DJ4R-1]MCV2439153.1 hypothetical protein [Paucibacter sp. DJ2R-2]
MHKTTVRLAVAGVTLSLAGPAWAFAHASEGQLLLLLLAVLAGVFLPPLLIAAASPTIQSWIAQGLRDNAGAADQPLRGPWLGRGAVFILALVVWGALISGFIYERLQRDRLSAERHVAQRKQEEQFANQAWQQQTLRVAACADTKAALEALMSVPTPPPRPVYTLDVKLRVAKECAIERPHPEILALLLDDSSYAEEHSGGPAAITSAVFRSMNPDLLAVLARKQLPLSADARQTLWQEALRELQEKNTPLKLDGLRALQAQGVNLKLDGPSGQDLLRFAVETQAADVIEFALDLGLSPDVTTRLLINVRLPKPDGSLPGPSERQPTVTEVSNWSTLQSWTLRRFGHDSTERFGFKPPPLSEAEIASIDKRMRPLTPEEAALRRREFTLNTKAPDGGAALFAYMLQRGVALDTADAAGHGLFSAKMDYSAPLLAVLAGLSDEELQRINCPTQARVSLRAQAAAAQNQALLRLLDARPLRRCAAVA